MTKSLPHPAANNAEVFGAVSDSVEGQVKKLGQELEGAAE